MQTLSAAPLASPIERHALIIEDDLLTGLDLQAMLQPLGYGSFAFASTPEQALEQAILRAPDLATVDLGLLAGNGMEAARAVESICADVRTIFITGDPIGAEEAAQGRTVLSKPVTALDLRRALTLLEPAAPRVS